MHKHAAPLSCITPAAVCIRAHVCCHHSVLEQTRIMRMCCLVYHVLLLLRACFHLASVRVHVCFT